MKKLNLALAMIAVSGLIISGCQKPAETPNTATNGSIKIEENKGKDVTGSITIAPSDEKEVNGSITITPADDESGIGAGGPGDAAVEANKAMVDTKTADY